MSLVPERNVCAIFTTAFSRTSPSLEMKRVLPANALGGVGLQVHCGIDE